MRERGGQEGAEREGGRREEGREERGQEGREEGGRGRWTLHRNLATRTHEGGEKKL